MLDINLELTSHCNAQCVFCVVPRRVPHGLNKRGYINKNLYYKIIRELPRCVNDPYIHPRNDGQLCLRFTGFGEPLLHPNFLEFISSINKIQGLTKVMLTTNGKLLSKQIIDIILNQILDNSMIFELNIGLDAVTEQTRLIVKRLKGLKELTQVIEYALWRKSKEGVENLKVILQFIIGEDNYSELDDFINFWALVLNKYKLKYEVCSTYPKIERGVHIWIKKRDANSHKEDEKNTKLHQTATHKWSKHTKVITTRDTGICKWAFNAANISWNGLVTPCCMDVDLKLCIGDLKKQSLKEIYRSKFALKLKESHINQDLTDFPHCNNCRLHYRNMSLDSRSLANFKRLMERGPH